MKKICIVVLILAMIISASLNSVYAAGVKTYLFDGSDETTWESNRVLECESAEACVERITAGWNLGCSFSAFSPKTLDAWHAMIYFLTPERVYNRSELCKFNDETKTAKISWKVGQDNGILQAECDAEISGIGIEICNYGLGENSALTYRINKLYYITQSGEAVELSDANGIYTTDMEGGTGGGISARTDGLLVSEVSEIYAEIVFVEVSNGEETAESIRQSELSWGNPETTQEMITAVKNRGFNLIRIQVSWLNHMDERGNVNELWLDRIESVVNYCINAGVYCLINTSGGGWLTADSSSFAEQRTIYTHLWEQIAERFADYGELLLFESCNEVLDKDGNWWTPTEDAYQTMNMLYQLFVDTVRAASGYNSTRNLVLNPYAATYDYNMNQNFRLPNDSVEGHLIAQVHCYAPTEFCMNEINLGHTEFKNTWGSAEEIAELDRLLNGVKTRFIDELGIPVIVGEFGTVKRLTEDEREKYVREYARIARKYGIKLAIFDDGGDFAVFDRNHLTWPYEGMIDALLMGSMTEIEIPERRPVENAMQGWNTVAYLIGEDGSYNRSDTFLFECSDGMAEIIWRIGTDDGEVLNTQLDTNAVSLGVELWNFELAENFFVSYEIESVNIIMENTSESVESATGRYCSCMDDGTGGGKIADLSGITFGNSRAIVVRLRYLGLYELPESKTPQTALPGWSAVAYFTGADGTYNRSAAAAIDADTRTVEIVWKLGENEDVIQATPNSEISVIGIEFWNFSLTGNERICYQIESILCITEGREPVLIADTNTYQTDMSGSTGGGPVAMSSNLVVKDLRAIVIQATITAFE